MGIDVDTAVPVDVRLRLRAATRAAHDRVDALFGAFHLADPDGYRLFLEAHAAAAPACEGLLERSGTQPQDWERRRRAPALSADLDDLGADAVGLVTSPSHVTPAEALGVLYVLEGSRLGGAILARRVAASACPASRRATRYLRHGEGEGLWPSFVALLEASPVAHDAFDDVASGAAMTFDLFARSAALALTRRTRSGFAP